jgi:hypothetical protein
MTRIHDNHRQTYEARLVGPMQPNRDDPARAQLLKDARLAAQVAQAVASPALTSALSYLELVSDNVLLPDALRGRAREAALRVAEAAVHLECLPDIIDFQELETQTSPP